MRFFVLLGFIMTFLFIGLISTMVWFDLQPRYSLPGKYPMELRSGDYFGLSDSIAIRGSLLGIPKNCEIVDKDGKKIELQQISTNFSYNTLRSEGNWRFWFTVKEPGAYTFQNVGEIEETFFGPPTYIIISSTQLLNMLYGGLCVCIILAILATIIFGKTLVNIIYDVLGKEPKA